DEVLQNSGNYSFILDGKSFLKRLTTVEMYVDHPEWNEGTMSNERERQISKKAILKAFNLKGRSEISRIDRNKTDDNSCLNFVWSAIGAGCRLQISQNTTWKRINNRMTEGHRWSSEWNEFGMRLNLLPDPHAEG
ncbi:hypothetical protein BGZ49_005119, partial [Haplosporangium sp. Z 27]